MELKECVQIVLASNSRLFLDGMTRILEDEGHIHIASQALDPKEVEKCLAEIKPRFLFLDNTTLDLDIDKILKIIKKKSPETGIILFGNQGECEPTPLNVTYITKTINSADLINTIKNWNQGYVSKKVGTVDKIKPIPTKTEVRIIDLVVAGLSNKDIAKKLSISEKTVKAHLTNIFMKFAIRNRYELIVKMKN